jgi:hypothetical protein
MHLLALDYFWRLCHSSVLLLTIVLVVVSPWCCCRLFLVVILVISFQCVLCSSFTDRFFDRHDVFVRLLSEKMGVGGLVLFICCDFVVYCCERSNRLCTLHHQTRLKYAELSSGGKRASDVFLRRDSKMNCRLWLLSNTLLPVEWDV